MYTKYVDNSGNVYTIQQIRAKHPNTSISDGANLSSLGYTTIQPTRPPMPIMWHNIAEGEPVDGRQTWNQVRMTDERISKIFDRYLDRYFNTVAQAKGYTDRVACAVRAGYPGAYQAECTAFATWMDEAYSQAYQLLNGYLVDGGVPPEPQEIIGTLPSFTWPE